jgi:mannose-6-phosphate isomerase-like protein (cupin superfamily)
VYGPGAGSPSPSTRRTGSPERSLKSAFDPLHGQWGGSDNRHRGADQWLFVVSGTGKAVVNGEMVPLKAGTLLFINRGDTHEIRNTGAGPLRTLNVYVPPAYTEGGEELPTGRK